MHSTYSDGSFSVREIINFAKEKGFEMIGISDHYETLKTFSVKREKVDEYLKTIKSFQKEFNVKVALEIDFSERTDIENLAFEKINELDYVLFEYVQDELWNGYPFWKLIEVSEKIKVPIGLAHNHIMKNFKETDMNEFLNVLETHNIFIELNSNEIYSMFGEFYYELSEEFFRLISKRNIPISVGSDMHNHLEQMLSVKRSFEFIDRIGLNENFELFLNLLKKV